MAVVENPLNLHQLHWKHPDIVWKQAINFQPKTLKQAVLVSVGFSFLGTGFGKKALTCSSVSI